MPPRTNVRHPGAHVNSEVQLSTLTPITFHSC